MSILILSAEKAISVLTFRIPKPRGFQIRRASDGESPFVGIWIGSGGRHIHQQSAAFGPQ